MAKIRVRFIVNKGRHGAPLSKLGRISEQAEVFLRALAADSKIETKPGEWLAVNFKDGSVQYDAEFQGDVKSGALQVFTRNLEFISDFDPETESLNGMVSHVTALEYGKIGALIDPDERVSLGIFPARGGKPKWREITYSRMASIRKEIEVPMPSYGALQGILYTWYKEAKDPFFHLREMSTDALVKVHYPATLYHDVADAVRERTTVLMVSGQMQFDRVTRHATELRADRIEKMQMLSASEFESFFGSAPNFFADLEAFAETEATANG